MARVEKEALAEEEGLAKEEAKEDLEEAFGEESD